MKPKFKYRFSNSKWHSVKMCNNCGTLHSVYWCFGICESCGEEEYTSGATKMVVKWVGIPFLPIGKFKIKEVKNGGVMLIGKEKYKIGMIVYGEPYGNYARRSKEIVEFKVIKVSNKYAELQRTEWNSTEKCNMTTSRIGDLNQGYIIYGSLKDLEDKAKSENLKFKIRKYFDWSNTQKLTLEQLERINSIIEE